MHWAAFGWWLDKWLVRLWLALVIGLILLVVSLGLVGCSPGDTQQQLMHVTTSIFGCQSRGFLNRFDQKLALGEKEHALGMLQDAMGRGQCIDLEAGQPVYLETSTFTMRLVRPVSSATAYWTEAEFVGP